MPELQIENISLDLNGRRILQTLSLRVESGAAYSIMGPSGSGKTSLLKLITGEFRPNGGQIMIGGQKIDQWPMEKRGAVLIGSDSVLFPHLTARKNICLAPKLKKNLDMDKIGDLVKAASLEKHLDKYPHQLSSGQRQRTALVRALAVSPRILLLDEAFTNLDRHLKDEMLEYVSRLRQTLSFTLLAVTHDLEEALRLGDNTAVIIDGRLFQAENFLSLLETEVEAASFFGRMEIQKGVVKDNIFTGACAKLPCRQPDGPAAAFIRDNYSLIVPLKPSTKTL